MHKVKYIFYSPFRFFTVGIAKDCLFHKEKSYSASIQPESTQIILFYFNT